MTDLDPAWHAALGAAPPPDLVAHVHAAIAAGSLAAHAADVVLAWRAAQGDRAATAQLERAVAHEITAAVRKIDRERAFVDEISQRVRIRLFVGDGEAPRIATYRGTGPLGAWVSIAAMRIALNAKRERTPETDDVLADVVATDPDPELQHLRSLYRTELREALATTLAALPERDRALLRMRFVGGLELAHIGKLYRVHESTASRWITAALERVSTGARDRLIARLHISAATADSVARLVASQLDLSIARLLGAPSQ